MRKTVGSSFTATAVKQSNPVLCFFYEAYVHSMGLPGQQLLSQVSKEPSRRPQRQAIAYMWVDIYFKV